MQRPRVPRPRLYWRWMRLSAPELCSHWTPNWTPGFNLILPSADLALAEGESQFSGDGLIPD